MNPIYEQSAQQSRLEDAKHRLQTDGCVMVKAAIAPCECTETVTHSIHCVVEKIENVEHRSDYVFQMFQAVGESLLACQNMFRTWTGYVAQCHECKTFSRADYAQAYNGDPQQRLIKFGAGCADFHKTDLDLQTCLTSVFHAQARLTVALQKVRNEVSFFELPQQVAAIPAAAPAPADQARPQPHEPPMETRPGKHPKGAA
ncbi:MAG TPA: hypothetical protein VH814_05175 [Steroidobacteraceae bacterium]|jgi:hypothetical protein